jgi:hypothetical protein
MIIGNNLIDANAKYTPTATKSHMTGNNLIDANNNIIIYYY